MKHDYNSNLKVCTLCGKPKPRTTEFFYKSGKNKDGLHYNCKECKRVTDKKSRGNSPRHKEYQQSQAFVYTQLKYQAKKRGIIFNLSMDEYLIESVKPCHYCGDVTKYWLDRYINDHTIGYTKANSVSCCEACNKMKRHTEPKDFIAHCHKVANNSQEQ